jgi:hypothetical protein
MKAIVSTLMAVMLMVLVFLMVQEGMIKTIWAHKMLFLASLLFMGLFMTYLYVMVMVSARNIYAGLFMWCLSVGGLFYIHWPDIHGFTIITISIFYMILNIVVYFITRGICPSCEGTGKVWQDDLDRFLNCFSCSGTGVNKRYRGKP